MPEESKKAKRTQTLSPGSTTGDESEASENVKERRQGGRCSSPGKDSDSSLRAKREAAKAQCSQSASEGNAANVKKIGRLRGEIPNCLGEAVRRVHYDPGEDEPHREDGGEFFLSVSSCLLTYDFFPITLLPTTSPSRLTSTFLPARKAVSHKQRDINR
jgi:hypothetical protein